MRRKRKISEKKKSRYLRTVFIVGMLSLTACTNISGRSEIEKVRLSETDTSDERLDQFTATEEVDQTKNETVVDESVTEYDIEISTEDIIKQTVSNTEWNGPVEMEAVDWMAFEESLEQNDFEALVSFFPVLTGNEVFHWIHDNQDNTFEEHDITLDEFVKILDDKYGWHFGLDTLSIWDLDGDGTKELILCLGAYDGHYLILHNENGSFYGIDIVYRGFEMLQTNGIYIGSSGAGNNVWYVLSFVDNMFVETKVAWEQDQGQGTYYIRGEEVDKEQFEEWVDENSPGDVECYFPIEKN